MVEFAFVLPLLLMLLFGITELGRALYQQNTLYKAVESGARYLARVNGLLDKTTCATDPDNWASWEGNAKNLIIYGNITGTGTPLLPNLNSDTVHITAEVKEDVGMTGGDVDICKIIVTADPAFAGLFGDVVIPFTTLEAFVIRAETEERYIGY